MSSRPPANVEAAVELLQRAIDLLTSEAPPAVRVSASEAIKVVAEETRTHTKKKGEIPNNPEEIARIHEAHPEAPIKAIMEELGVSRSWADRRVRLLRDQGRLPPPRAPQQPKR